MLSKSDVPTFAEIKQGVLGSSTLKFELIGVANEKDGTPKISLRNLSTVSEESKTLWLMRIEFLIPVDVPFVSFLERKLRLKTD